MVAQKTMTVIPTYTKDPNLSKNIYCKIGLNLKEVCETKKTLKFFLSPHFVKV